MHQAAKRLSMTAIMVGLVLLLAGMVRAEIKNLRVPPEGTNQMIALQDGTTLMGRITRVGESEVTVQTDLGEMTVAIDKIKEVMEVSASSVKGGKYWFRNPNRTRLLVGPTARTLEAGKGYFYDLWVFFPGLSFGITDNIMISGGASLIPGIDDQMFYLMPKVGFRAAKNLDLAATLAAFRLWSNTFYLGMGNLTYGTDDLSVSAGLGLAFTDDAIADQPAAMLGGEYRFTRLTAFVVESWFLPGDADEGAIAFGGMRLFGEQIAIDFGFGLSYDSNSEEVDYYGDPEESETHVIPYVDFVWNF